MLVKISNPQTDHGPRKYLNEELEEAITRTETVSYKDYESKIFLETGSLEELLQEIDYKRFVIDYLPEEADEDVRLTIYDYYIE